MELICPSCEARYQLPPGSVGEKGRQVSCMNCGNSWHAYPPLVLGSPGAPSPSQSTGINWAGPDAVGKPQVQTDVPPPFPQSPQTNQPQMFESGASARPQGDGPSDASRSEQLAEIRQMLAEVQSEDRAAAAVSGAGVVESLRSRGPRDGNLPGQGNDQARQRIAEERMAAQQEQQARAVSQSMDDDDLRRRIERPSEKQDAKPTDVRRIRRAHDRKVKRNNRKKAAGSGAFLTGFLLIAIIAAVMITLYTLHPTIIERFPGSEGALIEYVATIDDLRLRTAETFAGLTDWVTDQLEEKT